MRFYIIKRLILLPKTMAVQTLNIHALKQSKLKISIPFGVKFTRVDRNISKFLYNPIQVPAIKTSQGEYLFAYENYIWSVQKHEVKEIK